MKLASHCLGFYAIVLSKVEGTPFITVVLYKAETRNTQQQQQPGYQQPGYQQGPQSPLGTSSMGMQPNVAAGLSYVLGWVTGLIFFLVEKQNRFVRFHAMQSILFFGGLTVINIALNIIGNFGVLWFLTLPLGWIIGLIGLVGWIVLMINGFQGKYFKLPVIGDYAEKYANQGVAGM